MSLQLPRYNKPGVMALVTGNVVTPRDEVGVSGMELRGSGIAVSFFLLFGIIVTFARCGSERVVRSDLSPPEMQGFQAFLRQVGQENQTEPSHFFAYEDPNEVCLAMLFRHPEMRRSRTAVECVLLRPAGGGFSLTESVQKRFSSPADRSDEELLVW